MDPRRRGSKGGGHNGGGPKVGERRVGARRVGPEGWEAQNFALFFPSPAAKFVLFFSLWVFSWNFGGV